jgi:hypothetical protein
MTLRILALGADDIGPEIVDAALSLGGTLSSDALIDAVIEQFRAL